MKSINYRLAKAMGWGDGSTCNMIWNDDWVHCFDAGLNLWRKFDYRDPVIFAAIVKRHEVNLSWISVLGYWYAHCGDQGPEECAATPELAATMAVIAKERT
jgi:hypothetical protein